MAGSTSQEEGSNAYGIVHERTALLSAAQDSTYNGTVSSEDTFQDDEYDGDEIDDNVFDNLLSRSESINTGIGVEIESQETPMLRGPRRYSGYKSASKTRNQIRRKSFASSLQSEVIEEGDFRDSEVESKSPYLAGVSVSQFWVIFASVLTGFFVACFDSTIMVSSHPVITSYFQSSNSASWLSTAFLLTSTSFQPLFGRLSDTIGRKLPYVCCIFIFLIATIWCALAQSMTSFIWARVVCGLGAGGMMAMGSIITSDLVPIEIRGAYQSYLNMTYGVGSSLGAALGGAIADHLGWRWEFGVQAPPILLLFGMALYGVPRDLGIAQGTERKTIWEAMKVFDIRGSILLTTSITFLILGLNLGGNVYAWSHPIVITSLAIFSVCFPVFIWVESWVKLPIMPLNLVSQYPRAGLIISNSFGAIVINGIMFNIPLYFQAVLLETATSSGLRLIIPTLISAGTGTLTGFLITWTKQLKPFLLLGAFPLLVGTLSLTQMQRGLPDWAYILFLVPTSVAGGLMFPGTFMAVLAVSPQAEQAVVTSTLILWRSMGMVLGVALSSLVLQNALFLYLEKMVIGPDKETVIQEVRKSVRAIAELDPIYREQVIGAYAASLRAVFYMASVMAVITICLTVPIKLPKLGQRKK